MGVSQQRQYLSLFQVAQGFIHHHGHLEEKKARENLLLKVTCPAPSQFTRGRSPATKKGPWAVPAGPPLPHPACAHTRSLSRKGTAAPRFPRLLTAPRREGSRVGTTHVLFLPGAPYQQHPGLHRFSSL